EQLPAPEVAVSTGGSGAQTALEHELVALWTEVLGPAAAEVTANFFDLGGHSLLATRLIARLRERLGIELPLIAFFEQPTIRELARRLEPNPNPNPGRGR
ncbi:MAG: hypothetical protein JJT85_10635, partial [Chromatiales bacterium]|nr:hypothetical protein [Chromatiales bacterium]